MQSSSGNRQAATRQCYPVAAKFRKGAVLLAAPCSARGIARRVIF